MMDENNEKTTLPLQLLQRILTPYEQAVRESLPPPRYRLINVTHNGEHFFAGSWFEDASGKKHPAPALHREACLAAWDHFDAVNAPPSQCEATYSAGFWTGRCSYADGHEGPHSWESKEQEP